MPHSSSSAAGPHARSTPQPPPVRFDVIGDGDLSDAAIAAWARLLLASTDDEDPEAAPDIEGEAPA
jgi:hypothetical protein